MSPIFFQKAYINIHNHTITQYLSYEQEYRLVLEGTSEDGDTVNGDISFNIGQFAFKGPNEQRLQLDLVFHCSREGPGKAEEKLATVEAQILCKTAQKVAATRIYIIPEVLCI